MLKYICYCLNWIYWVSTTVWIISKEREAFLSPFGAKYLFCNTYRPHGGACPLSAASYISNYDITYQSQPKRTSGTYSCARLQKTNLVTTMGCINSGRQVAWATKFRTVDPKICRSPFWCIEFWNDPHIFWKISVLLVKIHFRLRFVRSTG
jgi:hypothetical protein